MVEEKLQAEVAAMRYVADHTTIPVPFVLHYGTKEESPGGLGPFIIMEWVDKSSDALEVLKDHGRAQGEKPRLNPNLDPDTLEYMYSQMADIVLQLSQCELPQIGSLAMPKSEREDDFAEAEVSRRTFSFNIAELGEVGGVPHFELPDVSGTYSSSSEYYIALADMHLQQLSFQRNQAVESADDCRRNYLARQLFRKLAAERRLANPETDRGPFKLWCDDLRPHDMLVDADNRIIGVIDWEFTYAAPTEFARSPPWWLTLVAPEDWTEGLDDWAEKFERRLDTFLKCLETKEREFIEQKRLDETQLLSPHMRRSWETGNFWITYAARKTWAFDGIFWRSIDERFFGDGDPEISSSQEGSEDGKGGGDVFGERQKKRLELLPKEQVDAMERFVERKLKEKEECTLVDWYVEEARSKLPPDILSVGMPGRGGEASGPDRVGRKLGELQIEE